VQLLVRSISPFNTLKIYTWLTNFMFVPSAYFFKQSFYNLQCTKLSFYTCRIV